MKRLSILALIILPLIFFQAFKSTSSKKLFKPAWVSLFDGKTLNHWIPKIAGYKAGDNFGNTFRVENGLLCTRYNAYDSFNKRFGALYFYKPFTNYRLKVVCRFSGTLTPGAPAWGLMDGGIQYSGQPAGSVGLDQPFPVCLEYNLLGGDGTHERPTGEICASGMTVQISGNPKPSYCTPPTVKRTIPGQNWVTAEIEVRDGKIIQYVNGEEVIRFSDPRYDMANANVKSWHATDTGIVKSGYISLQSNSHPMDFKTIEIMEY